MTAIQQLLTDHLDIWTTANTGKKSRRGRSSSNAASVYGIRKLRELILELAVRGKLVPQNPNDEPASELLKRIQAEKTKLVAEGKIKKAKPLPPINDEKKPFDLPKSWEWVHLPDVSNYKVGKTPSTKSSVYWTNSGDGFNWVSIADLNHDDRVSETSKQITNKAVSEIFRCEPAPAGTILMSFKLTLGKISIIDKPAFHNEAIISIYPNQSIFKDFLFKVLPARTMAGNSKSAIKGNTLNSESIAGLLIPLPPLAEQHRIVAKVGELMELCDQLENQHNNAAEVHEKLVEQLLSTLTQSQNAEEFSENWQRIAAHFDTLFTTETSIDALKEIVLQLAVMGKLVPQDMNDEPASELLKRIQAEKAKLVAEGKIKKGKPLPSIRDEKKPFDLPKGWEWVHLPDVSNYKVGKTPSTKSSVYWTNSGDGFNWVSIADLNHDDRVSETSKQITNKAVSEIFRCEPAPAGTILMSFKLTLGKISILDKPAFHNEAIISIYPNQSIFKDFLFKVLPARTMAGNSKSAIKGNTLNSESIAALLIPLPPLAEQHRIIAKINELMTICHQLKSRITEANQLQQKLANVMVEQAVA